MLHRQIISYFGDTASPQSPFSIQKLISIGRESGRKAGDWYGPASIANSLRYVAVCTLLAAHVTDSARFRVNDLFMCVTT